MKFFTFTILALVAVARAAVVQRQDKRGVAATNPAYAPASVAYKVQQPAVQKTVVAQAPQQYFAQAAPVKYAPAPATYAIPIQQAQFQYEPQPQAVAYAQPAIAKYAPAPAAPVAVGKVAFRPQFSLANDVSSFAYSSPYVTYNNLGLLSQVVGKVAGGSVHAKAAPAAPIYQQPLQKVTYQAAPVAYAPAPVQTKVAVPAPQAVQARYIAPAPQQYLTQVPQFAQQYIAAAPQAQGYTGQTQTYTSQPAQQTYTAQPAQQTYSAQAAQQTYTAQSIPQAVYAPPPQFFTSHQFRQANHGFAYAQ